MKKIFKLSRIYLILVLLLSVFHCYAGEVCEAAAQASCHYASPNGTGVGSYSDPASLQNALALGKAGDYVYLLAGIYSDPIEIEGETAIMNLSKFVHRQTPLPTAEQPLTIKAYPTHVVEIQGDYTERCVIIDRRSHYRFENFKISQCHHEAIRLGIDIPQEDIIFRNIEVTQVRYYDNSGFLVIHGYENVQVLNSVFYDFESSNFPAGNSYYIQMFQAIDVLIEGNEFYGNGSGIYYKHGESQLGRGGYTRIYANSFYDLDEGMAIKSNQNNTEVKGNLVRDAAVVIHEEDGTQAPFTWGTAIEFNTFVNGKLQLNQGSDSYIPGVQLGAFNSSIKNNILMNSDYLIWDYGPDSQFMKGIGLDSDMNCLYDETQSISINYFGASGSWGDLGGHYDLSAWKQQGFDVNSQEVDPQLDGNQRPAVGSACYGKGHSAFTCRWAGVSHSDWVFCDFFEN